MTEAKRIFIGLIFITMLFIISKDASSLDNKKRDPFVPLVAGGGRYVSDAYAVNDIKDIRLEGIVWEGDSSLAIINGEIIKEGDSVGSVKILKIDKDSVVFDVGGEEVRVKLIEDELNGGV
ncbi:MAG: general secretion pathway protein GspB [Candidatus Omnitrophota bacterium]